MVLHEAAALKRATPPKAQSARLHAPTCLCFSLGLALFPGHPPGAVACKVLVNADEFNQESLELPEATMRELQAEAKITLLPD